MTDPSSPKALNQPFYTTPSPTAATNYQRDIYSSLRRPKFSTKPHEWEAAARRAVPAPNFGYVSSIIPLTNIPCVPLSPAQSRALRALRLENKATQFIPLLAPSTLLALNNP